MAAAVAEQSSKWKKDFDRAVGELKRTKADLEAWELLAGGTMAERGQRTAKGALVRSKAAELNIEFQRLLRSIELIAKGKEQSDDTKKLIGAYRDELTAALAQLGDVQRRSKGIAGGAGGGAAAAAGAQGPTGDYQRMEDGPSRGSPKGVSMQPVTQRSLYEQQQQTMREFDAPLAALEGSVANIGRAANLIRGEVGLQNQMLENTNEAADRTQSRMGRVQRLMTNLQSSNQNSRRLMCWVIILLCTLIGLFIWVVTS